MASTSQDPVTLTAECLCKAHIFTTDVSKSQLPIKVSTCHCTSCRHLTGALYSSNAPWPGEREEVVNSGLKVYRFSEKIDVLFCGTCSTPMFWNNPQNPDDPGVFTGCLKNIDTEILRFERHIFVGDTIDGGSSVWLQHPNADGSIAKRYEKRTNSNELPSDWPSPCMTGYDSRSEQEFLPIHCRCRGVNLRLHRGDYLGKKKEEVPWFIDYKTGKMIASFDTCYSCRLQSGVDIFHWTFAELKNVSFGDGIGGVFPRNKNELAKVIDAGNERFGTLGYYQSSPDVHRYFCTSCSAVIFFASGEREEVVDVAVGVLDSPDGARAEGFLSWTLGGAVAWAKDCKGGWREGMLERVIDEAEKWRVQRGYPKNWKRIEVEEMAAAGKLEECFSETLTLSELDGIVLHD